MAMRLPMPPTQAPMRGLPRTSAFTRHFQLQSDPAANRITPTHLVRAPSCKRRGFGRRDDGKLPPQGLCRIIGLILGGATGPVRVGLVRVWDLAVRGNMADL